MLKKTVYVSSTGECKVAKKQVSKKSKSVKQVAATRLRFPDLTEFRKSIHIKGKPLSQVVIEGRG